LTTAFDNDPFGEAGLEAAHQFHVQFYDVRLEARQEVQAGVAGPEVIEGGAEPHLLITVHDVRNVSGIDHLLVLGELKDKPVGRELDLGRRFQGQLDAGFWHVDSIGQEVDRQSGGSIQQSRRCSRLDRLHAALLVESVTVGGRHRGENARGGLPLWAAHEGLIGKRRPSGEIHDWLEGHGKGEVQSLTIFAAIAMAHDRGYLPTPP